MINFKEILTKLNINDIGHYEKDNYIVDIKRSDGMSSIYSKLEKSDAEEVPDKSSITETSSELVYELDGCLITLQADYETDTYKLILSEEE